MSGSFSLGFDPGSLQELVRLGGFKALLSPEITSALTQAGIILVQTAQLNTWQVFTNPTGALADTIHFYVQSPSQVVLMVDSPYGRRREWGFSGMTDSLGRYYANDPGKPYVAPALNQQQQEIMKLIEQAVRKTLQKVGAR